MQSGSQGTETTSAYSTQDIQKVLTDNDRKIAIWKKLIDARPRENGAEYIRWRNTVLQFKTEICQSLGKLAKLADDQEKHRPAPVESSSLSTQQSNLVKQQQQQQHLLQKQQLDKQRHLQKLVLQQQQQAQNIQHKQKQAQQQKPPPASLPQTTVMSQVSQEVMAQTSMMPPNVFLNYGISGTQYPPNMYAQPMPGQMNQFGMGGRAGFLNPVNPMGQIPMDQNSLYGMSTDLGSNIMPNMSMYSNTSTGLPNISQMNPPSTFPDFDPNSLNDMANLPPGPF